MCSSDNIASWSISSSFNTLTFTTLNGLSSGVEIVIPMQNFGKRIGNPDTYIAEW